MLHFASFGLGFTCLIAACFVVARGVRAVGPGPAARASRTFGIVVLVALAATFATAGSAAAVAAIYITVVAGRAWLAFVAATLRRSTVH